MSSHLGALLDVNVLLALTRPDHVFHETAHRRFATLDAWSTCPTTEASLVRLLMTEQVVSTRISGSEALTQLASIRQVPGWSFLVDEVSLAAPVIDLRVLSGRQQVTDLQLVNLAAANEMSLVTFDAAIREALVPDDQHWVTVWSA